MMCLIKRMESGTKKLFCRGNKFTQTLKFVKATEWQTCVVKVEVSCLHQRQNNSDHTKLKTYPSNYILLAFIMCGEYYRDYNYPMGTLGLNRSSEKQWIYVIKWIASEEDKIIRWIVQQAKKMVREYRDEGTCKRCMTDSI